MKRRLPVGAEVIPGEGVHFRVWAPRRQRVEVVPAGQGAGAVLSQEGDGYFSGLAGKLRDGDLYRFRLDGENAYADPASRFQPDGPHGPSQVVDTSRFQWTDDNWPGVGPRGQVVYELHIGTFTPEGTWQAAERRLPYLVELGVTVVEVMPIADFPGRFGWGYDGVDMFAPTRLYGTPRDLQRFVDRAHALGLGVILDVVYNHFGPDGNYLGEYSQHYISKRYENEWGDAINFDGEHSGPVRDFFIANAKYWIDEYHFDGLRLDATQQIFDVSEDHILAAIARSVRQAAGGRQTLIVAENEVQDTKLVRQYGIDALWNDDLHHSAKVALTGRNEAYYTDYLGNPQEFISGVKWGYLFQGQRYKWQKNRRGTPALDLEPSAFVTFIENHDQVANSGRGQHLAAETSPGRLRAMTAFILLAPSTPMLFQGQEFGSSKPFLFFADHHEELAKLVQKGRAGFLAQFPSLATEQMQTELTDPGDLRTFEQCKLDWSELERKAELFTLHREILRLRREDTAFRSQRRGGVDGAVLNAQAFVLRFFVEGGDDRLLVVNFGRDLHLDPAPEPLLAPPAGRNWTTVLSTEEPRFGGSGVVPVDTDENWRIPGEAAVVLKSL